MDYGALFIFMKHIIPISGKDSLATAIIQSRLQPELDYEYIFNPTGKELPESIDWIKRVEAYLCKPILFIGQDMRLTKEWVGGFRPSVFARYCTRMCKIEPMEKYFDCEATVYYGLRADEPERIGYINKGKSELIAKYPLREQNYAIEDVLKLVNEIGLKPPVFRWDNLADRFIKIFGSDFIFNRLKEWEIDMLFSWRKRNNCYDCFFMELVEWVGLAEHHPDLFWAHVEEEETTGTREKPFYTIKDYPLRQVYANRHSIVDRYVARTAKRIWNMKQYNLFDTEGIFSEMITTTSCGLLCGK